MALTIPIATEESISLGELVADAEAILDPDDESTLVALAPQLRRLANNRHFLADFINQELAAWDQFQRDSPYTGQVFQLAETDRYLVRANVWEPPRTNQKNPSGHADLFMYQQPHNHSFSFLTVGYLGAGYQTTIYECDPEAITGIPGDRVAMTLAETTTLPVGKVMLYRAGRDIHRQEHPREYSISLNLLARSRQQALREQHYFDLERQTIVASMNAAPTEPRLYCYLARFVASELTKTRLAAIRVQSPLPTVRISATESLAQLCPEEAAHLWTAALTDPHPLVRTFARGVLDACERGEPVDPSGSLAL
jgi:hypothetical protein